MDEVKQQILSPGLEVRDYQSFVTAVDCIDGVCLHSGLFEHMNDVHEFFGHEYLLPCWNRELLKFWYSLPAELRIKQNLYEQYVTQTLGREFGITHKKVGSQTNKHDPVTAKIMRKARIFLQKRLYRFGISITRDSNNVSPVTAILCRLIKQKGTLKYAPPESNSYACIYQMEQRYGTQWFKRIRKALN